MTKNAPAPKPDEQAQDVNNAPAADPVADPAVQAEIARQVAEAKAEAERAALEAAQAEIEAAKREAEEAKAALAAKEDADRVALEEAAAQAEAHRARALGAGMVKCRVLPKGHGEIHTGETEIVDGREQAKTFGRGDTFWIARSIGLAQEDAGRVEIVEGL
jgi:DNA repair exonuclease SbcCD ATPase subunit